MLVALFSFPQLLFTAKLKTASSATCEDKRRECSIGVGYGYCTGNNAEVNFMKQYCAKSCRFCSATTAKCEDKQSTAYCEHIKRITYCHNKNYEEHFKKFCALSCGHCKRTYKKIEMTLWFESR